MDTADLQQIGLHHPVVRRVLDVQRNTAPNPQRLVAVEGLWAHRVSVARGVRIDTFLWCPEAAYAPDAAGLAADVSARARQTFRVSVKVAERLSERDRPDGLISLVHLPVPQLDDLRLGPSALLLVADGLEIPGNVGTVLRVLDAVGADALLLTNRRVRLTHPKLFRASQGAVLTVPGIDVDSVATAAGWLRRHDFDVWLADTSGSVNYRALAYRGRRVAFVVGSERYGVAREWYDHAAGAVHVPMLGTADSLNVAVSAAVLLYEARAQQSGW